MSAMALHNVRKFAMLVMSCSRRADRRADRQYDDIGRIGSMKVKSHLIDINRLSADNE